MAAILASVLLGSLLFLGVIIRRVAKYRYVLQDGINGARPYSFFAEPDNDDDDEDDERFCLATAAG